MRTENVVICFDLGGVLVRICSGWEEACGRAGLEYRNPDRLSSEASRSRRRVVLDSYQSGQLETEVFYSELEAAMDGQYAASELARIFDAWTLEEYPGIAELVANLNRTPGITTACLSNTNDAHWRRLANRDGRLEYPSVAALRHQLASHVLGCLKPDSAIYAAADRAFALAGQVPERVVFFDDLPENVEAAREHGWTAFWVNPRGDTAEQIATALESLRILPSLP